MELQRRYDDIVARGAEVLAISLDNLSGAEQIVQRGSIDFPILYTSRDSSVPRAYEIFNLRGDNLATPSVFIIDRDGNIVYDAVSNSYSHRISAGTVLANLP